MSGLIKKRDDIKVFILYMMSIIDYPLPHNTLNDLCVQDNFISSFDFHDCIIDLCESGCVKTYKQDGTDTYEMTKTGMQALSALEENLIPLVRDKAMHSAIRLLSFEKSGGKVNVDIMKQDFGYRVSVNIEKNGKSLLEVSLDAATVSLAERIAKKVRERPEEVFRGISSLLLDDISLL